MRYMLILLLCLFTFSGCMPIWVWNYYSPNASDGTVTKSICNRVVGPPDRLQIARDEVIIGVKANEVKDGVQVSLEIEVPAGNEVRLKNIPVTISIPPKLESFMGTLTPVVDKRAPWNINEPLLGGTRVESLVFGQTRTVHKTYFITVNVSMPKAKTINVKMPELLINNQAVLLPDITFSKDKYLEFFMPINC